MTTDKKKLHVENALRILKQLGFPPAQQNERSAFCLLALLNLTPGKSWSKAENPLIGITPIMNWVSVNYDRTYAPNSRETFRRQTMHQFCEAGFVQYNPDDPLRAVNSPKACYRIEPETLDLLRKVGTRKWDTALKEYLSNRDTLISRYAKARKHDRIPVRIAEKKRITLSPGVHSELIRAIIEEFAPRFAPGSDLIYAGDTGDKNAFFDRPLLAKLGVELASHGKMPDVVLYYRSKNWLLLIEAVTSHGPVDGKRHRELEVLFASCKVGIVYVTAFPTRALMSRYLTNIAWETEVWVADAPSHLIHFNGERFLGPYSDPNT